MGVLWIDPGSGLRKTTAFGKLLELNKKGVGKEKPAKLPASRIE
jgi:hypothetical protein